MPCSFATTSRFAWSESNSLLNSVRIRSALIRRKFSARSPAARRVSSSMEKSSCAENRTARKIRSASSSKRSPALPTQRMRFSCKSCTPPNTSTSPASSLYAIALIVKSRRFKSSTRFLVNKTSFGCLLSSYSPSIRYVVTSNPSLSSRTVTVPCSIPVSTVRLKTAFTSSGVAEVVISQSSGILPSKESLTQPPTAYASYPCRISSAIILCTFSGSCIVISVRLLLCVPIE